MKKKIGLAGFALLLLGLICCSRHPSESGTNDPVLDAEMRTMHSLEERMEALAPMIDSLSCLPQKSEAQEDELQRMVEQMNGYQDQWEEARRRAADRAQGDWNRVCPFKRSAGFDCVERY